MSEQRRLSVSDLVVGEPLPWDVYGAGNKLLLRRGHIMESLHQVEELVQRGLFIEAGQADSLAQAKKDETRVETPSALRAINMASKRLERLLYNLSNEADAQSKILEVGKALRYAIGINSDIALASIQLNRGSGNYAVRHCIDTALLALLVARTMHKDSAECQSIAGAALTMNIAMLRQQDQWQEKPEPLSESERESVHAHPDEGAETLAQAGVTDPLWLQCVRLHHEQADGSGYPLGARVGAISDAAKIVALADRYCAAIAVRKYKKSLMPGPALRDVFMQNGKTAEPVLAAYFIKELGTTPPGTLVRLQNGEIGVVTQRTGASPAPVVHAFIGPRGAPLSFPIKRDTGKTLYAIHDALGPEQAVMRFSMQQLWGNEAVP